MDLNRYTLLLAVRSRSSPALATSPAARPTGHRPARASVPATIYVSVQLEFNDRRIASFGITHIIPNAICRSAVHTRPVTPSPTPPARTSHHTSRVNQARALTHLSRKWRHEKRGADHMISAIPAQWGSVVSSSADGGAPPSQQRLLPSAHASACSSLTTVEITSACGCVVSTHASSIRSSLRM